MIILHTATRLFALKGFRETSMADLAEAAGVASGTILYHYKNKEELFLAILADVKDTILTDFKQHVAVRQYKNGMEMMEGAIAFYLDLAGRMEDLFLLLHRHDPHQLAEENPVCKHHLEAIYNCQVDIFERAVQTGQKDGSVREMPAKKASMILFSMIDGIVRLNTYKLYDGGALYHELVAACRRILAP
jgi:AcrR family transcriptional regulator